MTSSAASFMEILRDLPLRMKNVAARSRCRRTLGGLLLWAAGALAVWFASTGWLANTAAACPFCTAVEPTLAQRRDSAAVVLLAEVVRPDARQTTLEIHRISKGAELLAGAKKLEIAADRALPVGALAIVLGTPLDNRATAWNWEPAAVTETSAAYFFRAPTLRVEARQRLRYFLPYLEHVDPWIAEDAYREFGHAALEDVASLAGELPHERLQGWLANEQVRPEHKGFYGLALGLAKDETARRANAEFLRGLIVTPADDLRAGFDGILGGYLLLAGDAGLKLIEQRYLASADAADGDVRHALTALRFYHQYGHDIPSARLAGALRQLLVRPEFAVATITDLGRWQDWDALPGIAELYRKPAYAEPAIRRAIVGYVLACPLPAASEELQRLRATDARGVSEAEETLSRLGGLRQ